MTDYKNTLNLPQTQFPMKANLSQREPAMLKHWETSDVYGKLRINRKNQKTFTLHDGPPYANGDIHLGHASNKILKDIVIKFKSLSGYDAPYVPGWDCHGLPIELQVEKKVRKPGDKISIADFRFECRQYAMKQVNKQRDAFIRLGILGDWQHPYLTMSYAYEADIIRSLAKIMENGHVERGFKPVYWCIDCESALAEAEVEYQDKRSPAIDVRFQAVDNAAFAKLCQSKGKGPISVPIWTTTPWTLPANQAVALHPDLSYALIQCETEEGTEQLLIAEALLNEVITRYNITDYKIIATSDGHVFENIKLQHPFYDRIVPIVLAAHVTTETGTGAVHTAPGHGQDDYIIGQQYRLPIDNPVDGNGKFLPDTPLFAGKFIYQANDEIIELLKQKQALLHLSAVNHSYPHCWRHRTPVIFRATPQWFISMNKSHLRENAIDATARVKWIPDWAQKRMAGMIENRPDWCISRQRTWGVPLTVFIHKETKELHPNTVELMLKISDFVEKNSIEAWHELNIQDFLGDDADQYEKCQDTLDVWIDSGLSHACVVEKHPELGLPADLYIEGSDQYRGWFQSSLLTSCAMRGYAPFRQAISHGFTVDAQGRKMSKSLGNVIAPDKIVKTLGADTLRLWVAATDYRGELYISDEILKRISDAYRRIRNTARFLLANTYDFDPLVDMIDTENMLALDRFAVDRARILQNEILTDYNNYQFHTIFQKIHHFCSIDMGSFYLDIIKDRQYTMPKNSLPRRSAQTAMYHIAQALARWIAPILSFTADEIWQCLPGNREDSVFLTTWYQSLNALPEDFEMNARFWEEMMNVRNAVNKQIETLRTESVLGSALEAEVILYADEKLTALLNLLKDELRFVLITSSAIVKPIEAADKNAIKTEIPGLKLSITASAHTKCIRCWHRRKDIGSNKKHPEICSRCVENIETEGETRKFA